MIHTTQPLKPVVLSIPLEDDEDLISGVVRVEWLLQNERGALIATGFVLPDAEQEAVDVLIEEQYNVALNGLYTTYELSYTLFTDVPKYNGALIYQVEGPDISAEGVNTLVTPLQALSLLREVPNLGDFAAASRDVQQAGLLHAFKALAALKLSPMAFPEQYRIIDGKPLAYITQLPPEAWQAVEPIMLRSFKVAQLIEANYSLGAADLRLMRENGILSYTVGEVKQFIDVKRPVDLGLCPGAMRLIGRYLDFSRRINRA